MNDRFFNDAPSQFFNDAPIQFINDAPSIRWNRAYAEMNSAFDAWTTANLGALTIHQQAVYRKLLDCWFHARCCPVFEVSNPEFLLMLNISLRTLQRARHRLEQCGFIVSRSGNTFRKTCYALANPDAWQPRRRPDAVCIA